MYAEMLKIIRGLLNIRIENWSFGFIWILLFGVSDAFYGVFGILSWERKKEISQFVMVTDYKCPVESGEHAKRLLAE